jgi:hypothetical protein
LALQTRSLLYAVAQEVGSGQHGATVPGAWAAACQTVFKALWEGGTKSYFQAVVDGLIQAEIEAGGAMDEKMLAGAGAVDGVGVGLGESKVSSGGRRQSRFAASFDSRALEIAVITRLVDKIHVQTV